MYLESPQRASALDLLSKFVKSESLIRHSLAVEAAMLWYADFFKQETLAWGLSGLLHDFDYEMFPEEHPYAGNKILQAEGYSKEIQDCIMSHADYTNYARDKLIEKTLYAVDELSGLIVAATYMRPDKLIASLELSSLKKRFKDKAFAKGCNRNDIINGATALNIDLDIHMQNVLNALKAASQRLGL